MAASAASVTGARSTATAHLTLSSDVVVNNKAPDGIGGAIYSCCGTDSMNINRVVFSGNSAGSASDTSGFQLGGAIFNVDGVANITASTFVNNQALGFDARGRDPDELRFDAEHHGQHIHQQPALGSQSAAGGAIFGDPAVININSSTFTDNLAQGDSTQTTSGGAIAMTAAEFQQRIDPRDRDRHQQCFQWEPGCRAARQWGECSGRRHFERVGNTRPDWQ